MQEHRHRFSRSLVRAGFLAALAVFAVSVTPREVKASTVCAPNGRGCFYTRVACPLLEIPSTWTCTRTIRTANPQRNEFVGRTNDGRAVVLLGGHQLFILSDSLEMRLSKRGTKADEFARLVLADRGTVSDPALAAVAAELGVPFGRPSPPKR